MFEKKSIIYSEAIGVCVVEDITKLSANKNSLPIAYYVLRSIQNKDRVSYIPVQNHSVHLRELISPNEAQIKLDTKTKLNELERNEIKYVLEHSEQKVVNQ